MTTSKSEASRFSRIAAKLSETAEGRHVLLQQVLTGEGLPGLIALRRVERLLDAGASVDDLKRVINAVISDIASPLPAATVREWVDAMIPEASAVSESPKG